MKKCFFYRIRTDWALVPEGLQRDTRLPGNPLGNQHVGYALRRRELLLLAAQDKALGGSPDIEKLPLSMVMATNRGKRLLAEYRTGRMTAEQLKHHIIDLNLEELWQVSKLIIETDQHALAAFERNIRLDQAVADLLSTIKVDPKV